jgi:hypothetical protein
VKAPAIRRLAPCLVGAAACVLYLATLSHHYTGDSVEYALAIERADPALLLDPYHPLLHPAGLLFYRLWQLAGWTGRALLPLEVLNALAGGLCAGLLTRIAGILSRSAARAAVVGLGFAVSGGLWMLSVEAEFVTLPLALMLTVLWAILGASPSALARSCHPVALALVTAAAMASYVSGALLIAVVLVGLWCDDRVEAALRRRQGRVYLAAVILLFLPAYGAFLAAWSGGRWGQVGAYFFGRGSYGRVVPFNILHGIYAFLRSLALYPNLSLGGTTRQYLARTSPPGRLLFIGYYSLIGLLALAPVWLVWRRRHRLWPAQRRPLLIITTWTVLFSAFGFYWVPGDLSFWLPTLAAWWLVVALVLGTVEVAGLRLAAVAAGVVLLGVGNGLFEVVPRHDLRRNASYHLAKRVIANVNPEEIALVRGDDIAGLYLTYWGGPRVVYVGSNAESLEEVLARVEGAESASRLWVVDSDPRRAGWWDTLLDSSQWPSPEAWLRSVPDWRPEGSLVLKLTSARRP